MRHRNKGRKLGRNPAHQRALLRNLASALILTEAEYEPDDALKPKVAGRIVTTLEKAKEVRPLVEKCVTIARDALPAEQAAEQYAAPAERGSEAWKAWRRSPKWQQWAAARAPSVNARRRLLRLLGSKPAVSVLMERVAPRFVGRNGGYTRIMRLAKPRLGDAGTRAVLEFTGVRDRKRAARPVAPTFETQPAS